MKFNMRSILENVSNGQYAGIDIQTVPTMRKTIDVESPITGKSKRETNPHYGIVSKIVSGSRVFIGASYENMVKSRMKKEGLDPDTFRVESLPWGKFVDGGFPVIEHNGKYYLRVIFETAGTTQYFISGNPVTPEEILGLTENNYSENSQGRIENKVIIRTISIDNIIGIRAAGQSFKGPFSWS